MIRWLPVAGFPGYEVLDSGRVRSFRRKREIELHPTSDRRGYRRVLLRLNGKPYARLVHRLVAIAFLPNPDGLSDVAHGDGKPGNDFVGNLRWASHADNQQDMRRHGTMQDGEKCVTAKLTEAQVEQIKVAKEIFGRGIQRVLAAKFNVSTAQISRIVNGRRWASTF